MSDDTVLVCFDWDSGPYSSYYEVRDVSKLSSGDRDQVGRVPREAWERYLLAERELDRAEEALIALANARGC